ELHMARRGHADVGAPERDVAVHLLDLRAPAFQDVLRHRRPLNVGARILAGLGNEHALDGGERLAVAFGGARELLGLDAADLLELEAERLSHAHAFAGERDLEAPDAVVAQAGGGGEAGRGGDAVPHAVLHQLRPALAPEIGGDFRAVDATQPACELFRARRNAPVRLADAKHGVLLAAFADGAADAAGFVHVDRDERGDDADDAPPADDAGDGLFVQAVLQRDDEATTREVGRDQLGGPA